MTDFRALCAEVLDKWDSALGMDDLCDMADIMDRTRAALSEPVAPSDEELLITYSRAVTKQIEEYEAPWSPEDNDAARAAGLRAVLARWGTASTPIPVSERLPGEGDCDAGGFAWFWSPEDTCWFWERPDSNFVRHYGADFCWLPSHALPLPAAPGEGA